jgi:hypothetical protein
MDSASRPLAISKHCSAGIGIRDKCRATQRIEAGAEVGWRQDAAHDQ